MVVIRNLILFLLAINIISAARIIRQISQTNDLSQFGLIVGSDGIVRQRPNNPPTQDLSQFGLIVGDDGIVRRDPNFGNGGGNILPNDFFTNVNQQQSIPSTTTSATPTTASPQYLACMENCRSTQEYNPVCGTDMINYHNSGRLTCAQRCGKDVQLVRRGTCLPLGK